jgi:hypothetical protein
MWVKRTEAEIAEERKRQRRGRLREAMLSGAFVLVTTCLFHWGETDWRGRLIVPADELLSRLPFAAMSGIILAFVLYKCERRRPMMVCPKCESTKYEDGVNQCPCGGHFEMMESRKYVA